MKKVLLSLGIIAAAGLTSFAQDANVGLKLGFNWSEWYGPDIDNLPDLEKNIDNLFDGKDSDIDNMFLFGKNTDDVYIAVDGKLDKRVGFHAGFQINSEINDYFWLKHEFIFATKGFTYNGTKYVREAITDTTSFWNEDGDVELRYRSYNVDIMPISLAGHYEGMQFFVGPMISVMLASNWIEKEAGIITTPSNDDSAYASNVNSITGGAYSERTLGIIDYGFVAGFEYELPFGLNAGIRFVQGFASVLETPEGEARTNAFNKDLRVSLGYTFGKE